MRAAHTKVRILYQGPQGQWAHEATRKPFREAAELEGAQGIEATEPKREAHGHQVNRPSPRRAQGYAHPGLHPDLHIPRLSEARQLPTILAQATSMVSAGLRSATKMPRSTRASSGSRSSRCSRSSSSGRRVICASCFWASLARICSRQGEVSSSGHR